MKRIAISKDTIKLIAAASMLIDHIGVMFFPEVGVLRIIGRLAFPVFSYSIYEGCKYTHSKLKYFLRVFILGLICMAVYYVYDKNLFGNILITFSCSICLIASLKLIKNLNRAENKSNVKIIGAIALFIFLMLGAYYLCKIISVDYGFYGIMSPVLSELFDIENLNINVNPKYEKAVNKLPLAAFAVGLVLTAISFGGNQYWSLLSVPLLLLKSQKKGKGRWKYFFYVFYPLHLAVLGLIEMIITRKI